MGKTSLHSAKPASPSFNPLSISGCKLWLKSNVGITKDGSDLVSAWEDQSDESNDVAQATGTNQPLWVDNVQNGLPVIRFDGVDNYMSTAIFTGGTLTQPNTIIIVVKMPSNVNTFVHDGISDTARHAFWNYLDENSMYAGTYLSGTTVNSTNFLLYYEVFNGASSLLRKSKIQLFTGNAGTQSLTGFRFGAASGITNFSNSNIGEVLIYDSILSTEDRDNIETYLTDRWAV